MGCPDRAEGRLVNIWVNELLVDLQDVDSITLLAKHKLLVPVYKKWKPRQVFVMDDREQNAPKHLLVASTAEVEIILQFRDSNLKQWNPTAGVLELELGQELKMQS